MKKNINLLLIFLLLLIISSFEELRVQAEAEKTCLSQETADNIINMLNKKKFFIDFCSACDPKVASIRRININNIQKNNINNNYEKDCYELLISGQIVRGIKPPVFGGYCTDQTLEVSNPSFTLDINYSKIINLSNIQNIYILNKIQDKLVFSSLGEFNNTKPACITNLSLSK